MIQNYATANEMKLNFKKCKFMLFNPTLNYDFIPEYEVEGNSFETVEEMRLLGLTIRNDLKWQANTEDIGPSGVRALPLAAGINVGGHYKWHFFSLSFSLSSLQLIANSPRRGCRRNSNFCMGS